MMSMRVGDGDSSHRGSLIDKVHTIKQMKKEQGGPTEQTLKQSIETQAKVHEKSTAKSLSKMEIIRLYHDKRRKELWCKALGKANYQDCVATGGT